MSKYINKARWMRFKDHIRFLTHPKIEKENKKILLQRAEFYKSFIPKRSLVFDVGANFGNRVEPLLLCDANIIAVEPQELCLEYLRLKFGNKITCIGKALGESEGKLPIYINHNATVITSMSQKWIENVSQERFKGHSWSEPTIVEVTTLNKLIEEFGIPEFIKIDVEGFELQVLSGLDTPVSMISIEYTLPEFKDDLLEILKKIKQLDSNYKFNYSIGESNQWAMKEWENFDDFIQKVINDKNHLGGFGDIYVTNKKLN